MAIKGINLTATEDYQLSFDPAKGGIDASTFKLRSLDSRVMGRIRDDSSTLVLDKGENILRTNVNMNEMNFKWVMFGLAGWSNVTDDSGAQIPFVTVKEMVGTIEYTIAAPDSVRLLPDAAINELADRIQARNVVTQADAKN